MGKPDKRSIKEESGRRWMQMGVHEGLVCNTKEFTGFFSLAAIFNMQLTQIYEQYLKGHSGCTGLDRLEGRCELCWKQVSLLQFSGR